MGAPVSTPVSPRQRVIAALDFRAPGLVPLEYHASPAGFVEHGERLRQLWLAVPDDFGPPNRFPIPFVAPGPHEWTDAWGVIRREEAFGAGGIPVGRPLDDCARIHAFQPPPVPPMSGRAFAAERERAAIHRQHYYLKSGWISLFELMHALRRFEDVLMDIATDRPEIHALADRLTEHQLGQIDYLLARGVDAIQFGDDFGTQHDLVMSPRVWRSFFAPRYHTLVDAARRAGAQVIFHTCGNARRLLDDIAALGVNAIWPQLNAYDPRWLAEFCRGARLAIALHPDRGQLMIDSTPDTVRRRTLELAEIFRVDQGGAWFYVEIDHGFPFENVEALTRALAELRGVAL
jgi:hypothetical protein